MMAHAGLCEKPADPKGKAEFDSKLAQMQAERNKQDQMWQTTTTIATVTTYTNGKAVVSSNDILNSTRGNHTN